MPLQRGSSPDVISANIAELMRAGHPQKQAEAIAYKQAGQAQDEAMHAAGIAFLSPEGRMLMLKRAGGDHAGEWCFPGGGLEDGETPLEAAQRECREEIGALPYGDPTLLAQIASDEGVHFSTFLQRVPLEFTPKLNDEHIEHAWAKPDDLPEPVHPGVRAALRMPTASDARMAFDKATVRSKDQDGRLHVSLTNISKANVCPYLGSEIMQGESLGLEPDRIYYLLRDPAELEKAAETFNNIPLMSKHVPVTASEPQKEFIVGSTGTDAVFEAPYLKNSLVVWDQAAIDGIESEEQCELSCAYRYVPDMTPGTYEGTPYDGVMRELRGNHVALVREGRAGPDVYVGDSQLKLECTHMPKQALSRRATMAKGALLALKPKLAADAAAKFNPTSIVAAITDANWKTEKPKIVAAMKPMLANDADLDDVVTLLDVLDGEDAGQDTPAADPPMPAAVDTDPMESVLAMLRGKLSDEDLKAVEEMLRKPPQANDNPPPTPGTPNPPTPEPKKEDDMVSKPAMDAAIKTAVDAVVQSAVQQANDAAAKRIREITEAQQAVRPWAGEIFGQDSAEGVYKAALEALGVKVDGVHPSAFRAILEAQPKPGQESRHRIAADAAPAEGFSKLFPTMGAVKTV